MLDIFSCACWPSVCLLWINVYLSLWPLFWLSCSFFINEQYELFGYFGNQSLVSCIICLYFLPFCRFYFHLVCFPLLCKSFSVWVGPICLILLLFPLPWDTDLCPMLDCFSTGSGAVPSIELSSVGRLDWMTCFPYLLYYPLSCRKIPSKVFLSVFGLATLPAVGWYVPWLLLSKYSDYCLLPVVEVGLCCPRRGGQVNHGVYMYFPGIDDCWNLSLRFVSSLKSCVVKTLARVDWGSGFSEVLLWPDPGATSPGALGRRSLGCRWVEREWEDGEGVGCCSPLWIQRPFPGPGCWSPPLSASPFHVYKQVSAIYMKCTPIQGPQHL